MFQLWPCRHHGEVTGREPSTNASDTQVSARPTVSSLKASLEQPHCVPKTEINTGITAQQNYQLYYVCIFYFFFIILMGFNLAFQTNFSLRYFSDGALLRFLLTINVDFVFFPLLYWHYLIC